MADLITTITETQKNIIKNKSAYGLPDDPSASGLRSDEIKKAFYLPITDTRNSVIALLEKVITDANAAITALNTKDAALTGLITAEETARESADTTLDGAIDDLEESVNESIEELEGSIEDLTATTTELGNRITTNTTNMKGYVKTVTGSGRTITFKDGNGTTVETYNVPVGDGAMVYKTSFISGTTYNPFTYQLTYGKKYLLSVLIANANTNGQAYFTTILVPNSTSKTLNLHGISSIDSSTINSLISFGSVSSSNLLTISQRSKTVDGTTYYGNIEVHLYEIT